MSTLSSYLFARPSFLEGFSRILDIGGTLQVYNVSPTPEAADYYAIAADWRAVGQDLQSAIEATAAQQGLTGVEKITKKESA